MGVLGRDEWPRRSELVAEAGRTCLRAPLAWPVASRQRTGVALGSEEVMGGEARERGTDAETPNVLQHDAFHFVAKDRNGRHAHAAPQCSSAAPGVGNARVLRALRRAVAPASLRLV